MLMGNICWLVQRLKRRKEVERINWILTEEGCSGVAKRILDPFTTRIPRFSPGVLPYTLGQQGLAYYDEKLKDYPVLSASWIKHIIQLSQHGALQIDEKQSEALGLFCAANLSRKYLKGILEIRKAFGDAAKLWKNKTDLHAIENKEAFLLRAIKKSCFANCSEYADLLECWLTKNKSLNFVCSVSFLHSSTGDYPGNKKPDFWHFFNLYFPRPDPDVFNADGTFNKKYDGKNIIEVIGNARIVDGWIKQDGNAGKMIDLYCSEYARTHPAKGSYFYALTLHTPEGKIDIPMGRIILDNQGNECRQKAYIQNLSSSGLCFHAKTR